MPALQIPLSRKLISHPSPMQYTPIHQSEFHSSPMPSSTSEISSNYCTTACSPHPTPHPSLPTADSSGATTSAAPTTTSPAKGRHPSTGHGSNRSRINILYHRSSTVLLEKRTVMQVFLYLQINGCFIPSQMLNIQKDLVGLEIGRTFAVGMISQ